MKCLKTTIITIFSIFTLENSIAVENCSNALSIHLKEAIVHNKKFKQHYLDLSNGESSVITSRLILMEKVAMIYAKQLDVASAPYQKNNIPIICAEISSMNLIRATTELIEPEYRPKHFSAFDIRSYSKKLKQLIHNNQFEAALEFVNLKLEDMEINPEQLCLTRHFLESISVSLKSIPFHRKSAAAIGLSDPTPIIKKFLKIQRLALGFKVNPSVT